VASIVVTIVVVAVLGVELLVPLKPLLLVLDGSVEGLIVVPSGTESDEGETITVDLSTGDVAVGLGGSLLELVNLVLETMAVVAVVSMVAVMSRARGGGGGSCGSRGGSSGGVLRTVVLLVGGRLGAILAVVLVVVSTVSVLVVVVSMVVPFLELQDLLGELLDFGRLLDSVVVGFTITEVVKEVENVQFDFSVVLKLVVLLVSQSVDEDTRDVSLVMGVITVVASVMTGSSG
jgi:hypothetical protein